MAKLYTDKDEPENKREDTQMGLSTHVLDTAHGCPAEGMSAALYATAESANGLQVMLVKAFTLNSDGRNPNGLLFEHDKLKVGTYRLVFDVAGYFKAKGVQLPEPNFLNKVSIDFGIAKSNEHYHVPLLVSPWSYSTYRGS
jgi:5-hydroxyisourate hydrolase